MQLYVGNLSYRVAEDDLRALFEQYGDVVSAKVMTDRETGRSRGFGFVHMADADSGQTAMTELNEQEFWGRPLRINEARPREDRPGPPRGPRPGGGGGYGGGGGGGYAGGGGGYGDRAPRADGGAPRASDGGEGPGGPRRSGPTASSGGPRKAAGPESAGKPKLSPYKRPSPRSWMEDGEE